MASARSFVPIKTKSPLLGEVLVQVQLLHSQNVFWIFSRPLEIYRSVTLPVEQVFVNKPSLDASLVGWVVDTLLDSNTPDHQ